MSEDLDAEALQALMPGREVRSYPALLSTDADAVAWARAGAPAGSVVAADYQAAPRGRGGLPWTCRPGLDLGFSVILRPRLAPDDEGWLYLAAATAVLDGLPGDVAVSWPDRLHRDGATVADVAGHAGLGASGTVDWAVVNVLVAGAPAPRGPLLADLVARIEGTQSPDPDVLARFCERCDTLGRPVTAHLIPVWPDGVQISGRAAAVKLDGALVVEEDGGRRMAVRPQHLARLDVAQEV